MALLFVKSWIDDRVDRVIYLKQQNITLLDSILSYKTDVDNISI